MRTLDKFLLEIDKPLIDEIELSGGLKLYLDPSWVPEWNACSSGKAAIIPQHFDMVKEGDDVALSYHIIAHRSYPNTDENYYPVTEGSPHYEKYKNAKGFWLRKQAVQLPSGGVKWVGLLQDNRMELIDGCEGTQSDVERWLSQFSFGDEDHITYANLVEIEGKQYWKADDYNIFAKRQGNEILSVSDRVICVPIQIDLTTKYNLENGTIEPAWSVVGMYTDRAIVLSGGENNGLSAGDIIGFEPKYCERYTLWGMECFLIKSDRVDVTYQPEIKSPTKIIENVN